MTADHHQEHGKPGHKAGFLQLTFMIYGAACGGAFGCEDMISGTGPGIALATLALLPFLFSIPVSLAVAELTTTFPVEGGTYKWSQFAFGDFWGFQAGWWAWMSGVMTNSLYAVLFADYLQVWYPGMGRIEHWVACLALIWLLHYLNVRGIDVVGNAAILLSVLLLLPFLAMTVLGLMQLRHDPIAPFVAPGLDLGSGFGSALALGIFLYSGYERLSTVAEEVENPQKLFPPALFCAATLALLSYVVPTAVALAAKGRWHDWSRAYFPVVAEQIGGPWLGNAMTLAGLFSCALLLNVTILSVSRVPLALAEDGFLPPFLKRLHPVYGTPTQSLLWGSLTYSALTLVDFSQLLVVNCWFQMACNILVYANVWALRRSRPDTPRPFRVPFGKPGLALMTVCTVGLATAAIASTIFQEDNAFARYALTFSFDLDAGQGSAHAAPPTIPIPVPFVGVLRLSLAGLHLSASGGQLGMGLLAMVSGAAVFWFFRLLRRRGWWEEKQP
ncbi:MAG: APC family permease [Candidatus Wallbacteria bacterium]|nr:APC family permease [Candidatus Wallbacteria bacterium]